MKKISLLTVLAFFALASCDEEPVELPQVYVEDTARFEGDDGTTTISVRVRMDKESSKEVTLNYETRDGEAVVGDDYMANSGTLTIPAGSTEGFVEVEVLTDTTWEMDENLELVISNAVNAEITGSTGTITIRNDDEFLPIGDEGYTTPTSYSNYTLVWADEFDGNTLNTSNWTYEVGTGNSGWGNNELQRYQSGTSNAFVTNGKLVIEARSEGGGYTSARIKTQDKQFFKYGRIDIRAKLPYGQGIWPALWMLGQNFSTVGWPACGEIDIMEIVGHEPNKLHGTVHWDQNGNHAEFGGSTTLPSGTFADEYNVFSIIWDSQSIKWYLNDVLYHTIDITPAELSEFRDEFFFIFNVAVGGNWPGNPDATTTFPQRMIVDYVRVFQ